VWPTYPDAPGRRPAYGRSATAPTGPGPQPDLPPYPSSVKVPGRDPDRGYPYGRHSRTPRALRYHVGTEDTALVFTSARRGVLSRGNFRGGSGWAKTVAALGVPGLHFHDLRHTGNMLPHPGRASLTSSADGTRQRPGRDDLPARHSRREPGNSRSIRQAHQSASRCPIQPTTARTRAATERPESRPQRTNGTLMA
jgi:hypothetical protein